MDLFFFIRFITPNILYFMFVYYLHLNQISKINIFFFFGKRFLYTLSLSSSISLLQGSQIGISTWISLVTLEACVTPSDYSRCQGYDFFSVSLGGDYGAFNSLASRSLFLQWHLVALSKHRECL